MNINKKRQHGTKRFFDPRLLGTWESDRERTLAGIPKARGRGRRAKLSRIFGHLRHTFDESSVRSIWPGESDETGPYEVIACDEKSVFVRFPKPILSLAPEIRELHFVEDDVYWIQVWHIREYFRRVSPTARKSSAFQSPTRTRAALREAARSGDPKAQFDLACEYDFTRPKRKRLAIGWYRKAAEQGHAKAQNYLAESLRDGWSVKRDRREAVEWFRQAAAQGNTDAQLSLGCALFEGKGTRKNWAEALCWYRKAARAGNEGAMHNLGQMYRRGEGAPQNWRRAIRYYLMAARRGHVGSMAWLGRIYGGFTPIRGNRKQAFQWLTLASTKGDADSQSSLGVCYMYGRGVEADSSEAARWYRRAADQGDAWGCYLLGLCYRDGDGLRRNKRLARHWLKKAVDMHISNARKALRKLA